MNTYFELNKATFRMALAPMFELLLYKKQQLSQADWLSFVTMTESSIILNPQQFLGNELPVSAVTTNLVQDIFKEFLQQETEVHA